MNSTSGYGNSTLSHSFTCNQETMETGDSDSGDMDSTSINEVHRVMPDTVEDDQIYMSVLWHNGKLGMAYYDTELTQIFMLLDIVESDDFLFLKRILRQLHPTCVLLSSKQDDRLVQTLKSLVSTNSDAGNISLASDDISLSTEDSNKLQFLPSIDFNPDICKRRILNLDLPGIPDHYTDTEKTLYFSSLISFDNITTIRATGGLLKYLEKMRVGVELEDASVRVPVMDLKVVTLDDQVSLDDTAFSALQIFQKEAHPSVYKIGQGGAKEGLSLFGVCCDELWFLRPIRDIDVIKQRQDAIAFFVNPRNIEVFSTLTDCMKNIKNIVPVLKRMYQAQATVIDWQALYKISEAFKDDLHRIANLINKIVDFEESKVVGRFVVKPNVDAELDDKKRTYNGLPDFMTKLAAEELERLSDDIQECNVIYLPQLGYLLAIPRLDYMQTEEDFEMPGLEFVSFIHDIFVSGLMIDQETAIMHKLQNAILESYRTLIEVQDLCAELDCFVPAESAVIGCVDRIFTRIRTMDSVSVGLSTFMIDVNQMSEALRDATERSLVVVDEFGKGTELVDGMALLCSCLSFWIDKGKSCPHVLVSTHFHSIIHQQLLPESPMVKFLTMDSLTEEGELLFLYQLVEGHARSSYASHVALQAGLPQEIVKRGKEVSELIRQNKPVYAIDTADTETHFKRSELIVKKFLDLDLETDDLESFLRDFVMPTSEGKL
uniref:MutS-like protein 5 n=1 Tax=Magallana gigas TaxID=29159 RepID=K1S1Q1_MAGGI